MDTSLLTPSAPERVDIRRFVPESATVYRLDGEVAWVVRNGESHDRGWRAVLEAAIR
jgi:hypothetical protein